MRTYNPIKLITVLTLTCVLAGALLAWVDNLTREPIAQQEKEAKLRAIRAILPPFDNNPSTTTKQIEGTTCYLGTWESEVSGVAFDVFADGFSGKIKLIMGVDREAKISGVWVLGHLETPGLGANITKPWFTGQFKDRSLENSRLVAGRLAVEKDGGDIDAITGATISSRAVTEAVSKGLHFFQKHGEELLDGKEK
jgi:electron transport complex protein RnfG